MYYQVGGWTWPELPECLFDLKWPHQEKNTEGKVLRLGWSSGGVGSSLVQKEFVRPLGNAQKPVKLYRMGFKMFQVWLSFGALSLRSLQTKASRSTIANNGKIFTGVTSKMANERFEHLWAIDYKKTAMQSCRSRSKIIPQTGWSNCHWTKSLQMDLLGLLGLILFVAFFGSATKQASKWHVCSSSAQPALSIVGVRLGCWPFSAFRQPWPWQSEGLRLGLQWTVTYLFLTAGWQLLRLDVILTIGVKTKQHHLGFINFLSSPVAHSFFSFILPIQSMLDAPCYFDLPAGCWCMITGHRCLCSFDWWMETL